MKVHGARGQAQDHAYVKRGFPFRRPLQYFRLTGRKPRGRGGLNMPRKVPRSHGRVQLIAQP